MRTPKIIPALTLSLLFSFSDAQAYQVGDQIDEAVARRLELSDGLSLVNFFASWCTSCKKEQPLIQGISGGLQGRVRLVGVDTDENLQDGVTFQKSLGLTYPIVNDTNQEIVTKFSPLGMPAFYYLHGRKVVKMRLGAVDHIDAVIDADLKELKP
ncbi:MAG: redoxin domain-containing protein [Magnetococcales bacterium]|nr:redoxin domain-containing protein [Magnetococcales bacterium]